MSISHYEHNRNWRLRHPERWQAQKKRRNDLSKIGAKRLGARWTSEEDLVVLDRSLSAMEAAKKLGRSERAVSNRRYNLRVKQRTDRG